MDLANLKNKFGLSEKAASPEQGSGLRITLTEKEKE